MLDSSKDFRNELNEISIDCIIRLNHEKCSGSCFVCGVYDRKKVLDELINMASFLDKECLNAECNRAISYCDFCIVYKKQQDLLNH